MKKSNKFFIMDKNILNSLNKVKKDLFGGRFFGSSFEKRVRSKLKKGVITLASIIAIMTAVNTKAQGQFSPTLSEFKSYIEHVQTNPDLDSAERERQYDVISAYSAQLSEKILIEIQELINEGEYLKAGQDIKFWTELMGAYQDPKFTSDLRDLAYQVIHGLERDSNKEVVHKSYEILSMSELVRLDPFAKMNLLRLIGEDLGNNPGDQDIVNYLAKVYVSSYQRLQGLEEGRYVSMNASHASARFTRNGNVVQGTLQTGGTSYEFSFSLD